MSAVMDVLRSKWIGTGKVANQLESEFSKFMGGGHSVAVSSCSIGLLIALKAVGLCQGENVLTTPLTFCATVNAIIQAGGRPIFSDVDKDGLLDKSKIEETFVVRKQVDFPHTPINSDDVWTTHYETPHYILPVNYLGKSAFFHPDSRWPVPVIEDAAHSFGGSCGYGDITVFSLYATKNITSGEGGIIFTNKKELSDQCRLLSNHGQSSGAWSRYNSGPIENYRVVIPGLKGNLPDILAAIGLVQLRRWPELKEKRDVIWEIYEEAFGKKEAGHSRHLYTIRVKNRAKVREALYLKGIGTGVHYEALHLEPAYQYLGYKRGDFPVAERIGSETVSLPLSATMDESEANYVVQSVREVLNGRT